MRKEKVGQEPGLGRQRTMREGDTEKGALDVEGSDRSERRLKDICFVLIDPCKGPSK